MLIDLMGDLRIESFSSPSSNTLRGLNVMPRYRDEAYMKQVKPFEDNSPLPFSISARAFTPPALLHAHPTGYQTHDL
jgi:hypothetical protein